MMTWLPGGTSGESRALYGHCIVRSNSRWYLEYKCDLSSGGRFPASRAPNSHTRDLFRCVGGRTDGVTPPGKASKTTVLCRHTTKNSTTPCYQNRRSTATAQRPDTMSGPTRHNNAQTHPASSSCPKCGSLPRLVMETEIASKFTQGRRNRPCPRPGLGLQQSRIFCKGFCHHYTLGLK